MNYAATRRLALFVLLAAACALAQGVHVTLRANPDPFPAYQSYAGVWGDGVYAYIGSERRNGVLIYDVSNPDAPVLVGTYAPTSPSSFDMEDIKVANGIGYFADNSGSGLHIVDVSNPASPTLISQITSANGGYDNTHKVAVWQNFVFVPQNLVAPALIKVFDVTNPASPVLFTTITATDSQWVNDLDIQTTTGGQTRMYTAGWNNKGDIWDITNLATSGAVKLGSFTDGSQGSSVSATDDGNYIAYSRKTTDGKSEVKIWNITNPAAPVLVSTLTMSALGIDAVAPHDPKIMGNLLYVSWFQAGTLIFDITNPATPVLVGSYDTYPGVVSPGQLDGNWGVYPYLGKDRVLLSDRNTGLYIVDTTSVSSAPALYNLQLNPNTVLAGSSSTGTVYLVGLAGVSGTVVTTSTDNAAATTPASVTVPQNATSANFTIATTLVASTTTANISTSYGGATNTAQLTITPTADFAMALGPAQLTLFAGQSGTFNGTITGYGGYTNTVALSCVGSPPTCNFSPAVVTPTTSGAPFSLTVSSGTTSDYSFNVQGIGSDSKNITHQVAASVSVVDFTLSAPSPTAVTVFPSTTSQVVVQVGAAGSFSGAVTLSCDNPATGVTCSFSPSASVNPTSGHPVNVTVTVATTGSTPTGQYTLTISANAAGAPAPKAQTLSVNVVDFTLGAPSPTSIDVLPSTSAQFILQAGALGNFNGSVTLSCNAPATGMTCSFSPSATVNPTLNTPVQVTVTVATASTTPIGQYNLMVSASSAGAPATKTQDETVNVVEYTVGAPSPTSVNAVVGGTAQFALQVGALGNFSGMVALACNVPATGVTCSFAPSTVVSPTASTPVNVTVTVATTNSSAGGQYLLSLTATAVGSSFALSQSVPFAIMDFAVSSSAASQSVTAGHTASFPLTFSPVGGSFPNSVTLACSGLPTLASCTFSPASVTPGANSQTVTLAVSTTAAVASARPMRSQAVPLYALYLPLMGVVFAGPILGSLRRKKLRLLLGFVVVLIVSAALTSCGGGASGGNGTGPQPQPGTPSGTYTITVNAVSGSLTHSTTVKLTVQ